MTAKHLKERFVITDKEEALTEVALDGMALQLTSPGLQTDRKVVLKAVATNGRALRYASPALKTDSAFVLEHSGFGLDASTRSINPRPATMALLQASAAAVNQNSLALQYASDALKADDEVISVAVAQNPNACEYALTLGPAGPGM
jgi:hypothetical protein